MKILVIDDNKSLTDTLETYLKKSGHSVSISNDGHEGFDKIKNGTWDKVLLDLSMPEFSGFDIINKLESKQMMKDKNIIVFSAASIPDYVIEKLQLKDGVIGFLKKPLSIVHLSEALAA